jgi:hypothetical protein
MSRNLSRNVKKNNFRIALQGMLHQAICSMQLAMIIMKNTQAKVSHLVASLPTCCQQVVFALLVPSCQQVWNKLLTTCNNLVDIIRLVARLFQQVRCSHEKTILLQPCVVKLITFLLYHDYIRLVRTTLHLIMPSSLLQVVNSLFQTCCNNWEQAVRTQLVDSLRTNL